jgi:hypothetical protein
VNLKDNRPHNKKKSETQPLLRKIKSVAYLVETADGLKDSDRWT